MVEDKATSSVGDPSHPSHTVSAASCHLGDGTTASGPAPPDWETALSTRVSGSSTLPPLPPLPPQRL